MRNFALLAFIHLAVCGCAVAQSPQDLLNRAREIKLLESDRHNVRQILHDLNPTDDDNHFQRFSNDQVDIEITYASGSCSDDADEEEQSDVWKVEEWKAVRVEISFDEDFEPKAFGFDLTKYLKEQKLAYSTDDFIYHDKARGMAFETSDEGIELMTFFPPEKRSEHLCEGNSFGKEFYSRKSWFKEALEDRRGVGGNPAANVTGLNLDKSVVDATSSKTVRIETVAIDPDNDPLFYNYTVSAGRIQGTGAKVVWDLTGVSAGTYTITAGVDDGCGLCGQTLTKTVTVK